MNCSKKIKSGALDIPAGQPRLLANMLGWSSDLITIVCLPAAITIAILRYRLWDIDRRFFRRKYDAERALKSFVMIARDEVKMDQLASGLLGVVNKTMQPERADLRLMKKGNTTDQD